MIGIDTNILVRYLTQDDLTQAKIVEELFNKNRGILRLETTVLGGDG